MGTRRQILTFLFGVLFPGISLIALGVILVNQADEISRQRTQEARALQAREIADSAYQWLEQGYQDILLSDSLWYQRHPSGNPFLMAGFVESGAFYSPAGGREAPSFSVSHRTFIQETRARSLQGQSPGALIAAIERRLQGESTASHRQELLVEWGRFARQAGRDDSAASLFMEEEVVLDATGTPYGLYAVEQDLASLLVSDVLPCDFMNRIVSEGVQLSASGWSYFLDLTGQVSCIDSALLEEIHQELALLQLLEARGSGLPAGVNGSEWIVTENKWLVRLVDARIAEPQPVVAIPVAALGRSLLDLGVDSVKTDPRHVLPSGGWHSLNPQLSSIAVHLPYVAEAEASRPWILFMAVFIILAMTTGGSVLLWQDSMRDKRLRQLQNQFVASVSHELRTPLTSIRIFSEAMLQYGSMKQEEQEKGLNVIAYESGRLSRMLNNVLSASRLESTSYAFHLAPGDLADAAESASEAMRMEYENAGVGLTKSFEMARATFDADAMEQVILNLLSNALKYGASDQSVELATWETRDNAHIRVTDYGPGIPEESRERLFERFYRSESTKSSVVGTGLGLWLVKEIVDAHDGSIRVVSSPGQGATFTVQIPVNR